MGLWEDITIEIYGKIPVLDSIIIYLECLYDDIFGKDIHEPLEDRTRELFEKIPGVGPKTANILIDGGYMSLEDLAYSRPGEIEYVCDLGHKRADNIIEGALTLLEMPPEHDAVESDSDDAWCVLRDEVMRQHTLSTQTMNSVMQRIGIILAFTPILLIEAIKNVLDEITVTGVTSVLSLIVCFATGLMAIGYWKWWSFSLGPDVTTLVRLYNRRRWIAMQNYALRDTVSAYDAIAEKINILRRMMIVVTITLLIGVVALVATIVEGAITWP